MNSLRIDFLGTAALEKHVVVSEVIYLKWEDELEIKALIEAVNLLLS